MTDPQTTDLCERLIEARDNYGMIDDLPDRLQDAADEIKRLQAALRQVQLNLEGDAFALTADQVRWKLNVIKEMLAPFVTQTTPKTLDELERQLEPTRRHRALVQRLAIVTPYGRVMP